MLGYTIILSVCESTASDVTVQTPFHELGDWTHTRQEEASDLLRIIRFDLPPSVAAAHVPHKDLLMSQ